MLTNLEISLAALQCTLELALQDRDPKVQREAKAILAKILARAQANKCSVLALIRNPTEECVS